MYEIESVVMHITNGICKIKDIQEKSFTQNINQKYYVLQPVFETGTTLFVPIENNPARIRTLLTKEEINGMMQILANQQDKPWINDDNQRLSHFKIVLKNGNQQEILSMLHTIYLKQIQKKQAGKKLRFTDEQVKNAAEKLVRQEFSYVLQIPQEKVPDWICSHITQNQL
ncbi:MAG: CarD family transcriptional regulator [Ruminococcus sp.]